MECSAWAEVTVQKSFLGRGWGFPFGFSQAGVATSEYEQNIKECITVILGTKPGERQMLPDFGCRIHEVMYSPNNAATSATVARHVKNALSRWEPRIEVTKVDAWTEGAGTVRVAVQYKIKSTEQQFEHSLVLGS